MWKYLRLIGGFKDVSKIYKEENGTGKPWYISRRFWGALFTFIGCLLYAVLDVTVPAETLASMSENIATLAGAVSKAVPVAITLYGAIMEVVGIVKRSKDAVEK